MKKRGISLIVLIITIIVVIILASIIILSFNKNNPIKKLQEAKFKTDVSQFKEELLMTHANNLAENKKYKSESVNVSLGDIKMKTYIPSITSDYMKKLYIKAGELVYIDDDNSEYDEDEYKWASDLGIKKYDKIGAKKISENASSYYGKKVEYTANGVSDWKIFYSDETNIYLISESYVDLAKLPEKNGKKVYTCSSDPKAAAFTLLIGQYSGSSDITDEKIKALNNDFFKNYTSENDNMKAVAYMLDIDIWKTFVDSKVADYAIGGPTIEMILKSYCDKYADKNYIAKATSEKGYQISQNSGSSYGDNITMFNKNDTLYCLPQSEGADEMWVASPSNYNNNRLMKISYDGSIENQGNWIEAGFRPVICLNSKVELNKDSKNYDFGITVP